MGVRSSAPSFSSARINADLWEPRPEHRVFASGTTGSLPMPRFTITTDAGDGPESFDEPVEFSDAKAATDDAQIALAEMARDKLPNGKRADFGVRVADETGKDIYQADLHFEARTADDLAAGSDAPRPAANPLPGKRD